MRPIPWWEDHLDYLLEVFPFTGIGYSIGVHDSFWKTMLFFVFLLAISKALQWLVRRLGSALD